jgi:hypothetical protein
VGKLLFSLVYGCIYTNQLTITRVHPNSHFAPSNTQNMGPKFEFQTNENEVEGMSTCLVQTVANSLDHSSHNQNLKIEGKMV